MQENKIIFSGIQPSGVLTLGNYLGALTSWVDMQKNNDCYYSVVDMHAITVRQDAASLRKRTIETLALLLATGIDSEKSILFMQSHVSAHAELAWVLNCNAYLGEVSRMTQFKEKSAKNDQNINTGLMMYPVLQAADILLYSTDFVPIGADQKQHLELARDIAVRFNNAYSETFVVPEPYIKKNGAKVMSLQEPDKKMSKSDENLNSFVSMLDSPEVVLKKFKRAVTDSDNKVLFSKEKPGVSNLMSIYSECSKQSNETIEKEFEGKGYGDFKEKVAQSVIAALEPIQSEYNKILKDKSYLNEVMKKGAEKATNKSRKMLAKVYRKIGFAPREI